MMGTGLTADEPARRDFPRIQSWEQATPLVATRAADGTLTLDNVSDDPEGERIAMAIGVLNRLDGFVAAAPAGAKT
jgi:hypothetical protein